MRLVTLLLSRILSSIYIYIYIYYELLVSPNHTNLFSLLSLTAKKMYVCKSMTKHECIHIHSCAYRHSYMHVANADKPQFYQFFVNTLKVTLSNFIATCTATFFLLSIILYIQ